MKSGHYILRQEAVEFVRKEVMCCFEENMELEECKSDWNHHGWFRIVFRYVPKNYHVYFEREFNSFNVRIVNEDGGYIGLEQIVDYENCITGENVSKAIDKLSMALKTDISFFKSVNGRRYRLSGGKYKRIKCDQHGFIAGENKDCRRSNDESFE